MIKMTMGQQYGLHRGAQFSTCFNDFRSVIPRIHNDSLLVLRIQCNITVRFHHPYYQSCYLQFYIRLSLESAENMPEPAAVESEYTA